MFVAGYVIDKIASKALDSIVKKVNEGVLTAMEPEFRSIENRLSRIEKRLRGQDMAPLKSAFFLLTLGEFDKALEELVRARSLDAFGAVARFWLAVILARQGRGEHACEQLAEALLLNPFVVPQCFSSERAATQETELTTGGTWVLSWYDNLAELAHIKGLGLLQRELRAVKRLPVGPWSNGPIHRVSLGGSHPVISWHPGTGAGEEPWYLSTLDLKTGRCLWNRTVGRGKLCFATPKLVVFRPTGMDGQFRLFDLETGRHLTDMDEDYFGTVYCPGYDSLADNPDFVISNKDMTVDMSYLKEMIDTSSGKYYEEEKRLMDPFGSPAYSALVKNIWERNLAFLVSMVGVAERWQIARHYKQEGNIIEPSGTDNGV